MKLTKRQKTISGFIVTAMVVTFVSGFLWVSWHMKEDAKKPWEKGVQPVVDAPAVSVMKLERADSYQRTVVHTGTCLLYTSPSPRDRTRSRMPSSA